MASQVQNPANSSANTAAEERSQKVQQYVNRQLEKTRRQVKLFDLVTGVVGLIAFVICFFLLAAIVDAWVWPLGTLGRFLGLAILVVGVFGYFGFFILPLFLRRINPDYAARMIEESKPTFKNSLLNYLSLRKQPEKTRRAVYDAVARQAAQDLSEVPEDSTVDRSNLIHVGFILVGISIAAVLYLVLSPKSPLPTIGRILSPVAKIAQPSIVKIVDVNPGDAKVFFGENLEVTASVRGRHDASEVKIIFSTDDGELLDQSIPMVANESLNRYQTKLTTDGFGIQQPLHYRVVAGDGSSPKYQIIVRPNPTISIQSAIITPPDYTKLPERTIDGQGDLQALEGSRIRLNAVANLPIKIAYIELLNSNGERSDEYRVTQTIEMSSEGQTAVGDFLAVLNTKRDKQLFTHFRVRFVSVDDDRNENPNVYPIRITPDLAPEVVIVNPIRNVIALPINQQLAVDIQATDLDFEISSVDLHLDHQGTRLLDRDLKFKTVVGNQRVTSRQIIDPTALNFKVGDKAIFFATAADNRTSPYGNHLDPNISRTENYTLVITSPREQITEPEQQEPEEQTPQDQEQKGEPGEENQNAGNQQQTEENSDEKQQPGNKNENQGQENGSQKEPGDGNSKQTGGDSQENSGNEGKGEQTESSEGQNPDKSDQTDAPSENNSGGDNSKSGDQKQTSNEGDGAETENGSQGKSQGANNSNEGQNGEGTSENVDKNQPGESGSRGSAGDEQDQQEGARDDSLSDGNQEPLPDDATLGDQFERLQELLKDKSQEDKSQEHKSQEDKAQEGKAQEGEAQEGESHEGQSQKGESQAQEGKAPEGKENQAGQQGSGKEDQAGQQGSAQEGKEDQAGQQGSGQEGKEDQAGQQGSAQEGKEDQAGQQGSAQEGKENQAGQQGSAQEGKEDQAGQQGSAQEGKEDQAGQQGSAQEGKEDQAGQQGSAQEGKENQAGQQGSAQEGKEDQAGQQASAQEGKEDQAGQQGSGQEGKEDQAGQQGSGQKGNEDQAGQQGSGQEGKADQADQQGSGQEGKADQADQQGTGQEGKSGQAGQQGSGQEGKEGQAGQQGSGQEGKEGQAGQPGAGQESGQGQPSDQKGQPGDTGQKEAGTNPPASDQATGSPGGQGADGNADLGDEKANLQYTKKATDLVLDKLESLQNDPDPELLKKMNWTKEDMQEFIQRWREMQEKAKSGNEVDRKRYENALRSLGLLPNQGSRQLQRERDDMTGLSEDGAVNQPPSHLIDAFNAFQRERNRVKNRRP